MPIRKIACILSYRVLKNANVVHLFLVLPSKNSFQETTTLPQQQVLFLLNQKRLESFLNQHSTWFYFLTDFKVQTENKLTLASKVYHLLKFCELDQIFLLGGSEIS